MVVPFSPKNFNPGFGVCSKSIGRLFKNWTHAVRFAQVCIYTKISLPGSRWTPARRLRRQREIKAVNARGLDRVRFGSEADMCIAQAHVC
jgi:hypothetical protein